MRIAINILIKDLRRHWWEIAVYLVSVIGWALQEAHPNAWIKANAIALFPILMFLMWFLLVIRVVQGESLVGTREFWTTRPHRAGQLMAAKFLLLILCIHAPLFVAEWWLLAQAGLAVNGLALLRLGMLQLEFFCILTLPAAALAAITASIVQWVLAIIGGVLAGVALSWLPWSMLSPSLPGAESLMTAIGFIVIASLLAIVLLCQYTRRRPLYARVLLGAAGLVVPLFIALASLLPARSVAYPESSDSPVRLVIASNPDRQYDRTEFGAGSRIQISVQGATASPELAAVVEGVRLHFTSADGWSHDEEWSKEQMELTAEQRTASLDVWMMPDDMADTLAAKHVNVEAELALALYRVGPPQRVETFANRFDLPSVGVCRWDADEDRNFTSRGDLSCMAAMRLPDLYIPRTESAENTCKLVEHGAPIPPGHHAESISISNSDLPVEFDPNPIRNLVLGSLGPWEPVIPVDGKSDQSHALNAFICRGTPFSFRTGHFEQRMRVRIPLGPLGKEHIDKIQVRPDDE